MSNILSRRSLLGSLALFALATPAFAQSNTLYGGEEGLARDPDLLPPPESPVDFAIPPDDIRKVKAPFRKQLVNYPTQEFPGTIIIDPDSRHLYLVRENSQAMRYGVGVGRAGFAWSGEAKIGMKRRWPRWLPPEEMVVRDEKAAKWANGMPGGPENPLGARAMYLYANGADTLYRIHGTNDPSSIGKALSSGCVRLLNQDIADLYLRVPVGSKVIVLPSQGA
jgi:lipoprotein-anchoring transpeptidase ErfK/SrfK